MVLPWTEVVIGSLLILGLCLRIAAPVAILVIGSLIGGTAGALYIFGYYGPRGCMPGLDWQLGISHIVAQVAMLVMASQIWLHTGEFLSLDQRLFGQR